MSKVYSNIHLFSQIIGRAAACLAVALFIFTAMASAATYTVDTTADSVALTACTAAANDCSLRGAIGNANGTPAADTIDFALPAGINTITLTLGDLAIKNAATAGTLTITNSTGASNLMISGSNASRVFIVERDGNLTLNGVTVTRGVGPGGGIYNFAGTLSLTNSIVSGNTSVNFAGGIYAYPGSTTTLTNSTVSGNSAPQGAGIYNSNSSTLTLINSTVSGNTAQQFGGGIYNEAYATATLTNSTVSGNSAPTGGGISNSGTLNLTSVTVAFNSATSSGGGIYNALNQGTSNLSNTIVAKNTGSDFSGAILSTSSFNLIGSGSGMTGITNGTNGNQVGIDPKLDPTLAFNGGTTKTHALLPGSPAIDKGNAAGTDQRGFTRPVDLAAYTNATDGNGADIGAFEAQAATYTVDTTFDDAALSACSSAPNDCSLRGAIAALNATIYNDTIDFALPAGSNTITLTGGELTINNAATAGTLTITNSTGASNLLISGNNASRVFVVNGGANLTLNAVTVTKGNTSGGGGGILNAGTLLLTNSIVSGNTAPQTYGGGIYSVQNTTLTLLNSTVSGNTSGFLGGGIATENGTFSLTNSTISGNTGLIGGGIFNNNGTFSLTNSTVSGNTAQQDGGGIYSNATLNLTSVTVAFNSSAINSGGGVYLQETTANLSNTIVAKNTGSDFSGAISSTSSFNLIGDGSGMSGITNGTGGNQVGIDPKLNPTLAFNGGTTKTHALLPGSPAIDTGNATGTDQRGFTRPVDLAAYANATGGNDADIGAFEEQTEPPAPTDLTVSKTHTGSFNQGDTARTYSITVTNSGGTASSGTITVTDTLPSGLTATAISGTGWICTLATRVCTRSDALAANSSYPVITLTVNVASNAPASVTNTVSVSGGGETNTNNNTANDVTTVNAVNYMVDTTADNAALTACTAATANDCSLRGAIARANATSTADTIGFALPAGSTITLTGGEIVINNAGALTITNSTGASNLLISGGNASRIFSVYPGANLTLNGVTVTKGNTPGSGGGVINYGTLLLTNSTVNGNTAGEGGGIYNLSGTVSLTNSTVSGNTGVTGGGIYNSGGSTTLTNSTVSGNTATADGGGIVNNSNGTLTLTNSTVSGNRAQNAGGIFNSGTLNLTSVTVAYNIAQSNVAGGVYIASGTANLSNTIVAKNTASNGPDFYGAISPTSSFNLIGNGTQTTGISNGTNGNQVGIDPKLNPTLALNGGTTLNHALLAGSPAIDRGLNANVVLATDQRGFSRIVDGDGNGTALVDIGAYEAPLGTTAASVSVSGRVTTAQGRGIRNVVVTMTDSNGNTRTATTTSFGYYRFEEVASGETYIFTVRGKRFSFEQNSQVHSIFEETNDINFVAGEQRAFSVN